VILCSALKRFHEGGDVKIVPYTTMAEAIKGLRERGFTANFEYLNNEFRAVGTGKTYPAEDLTIVEHYRFEGASDPDDMSIVYAIETKEGTRGVLTDAFGVYADPKLGAFLKNVKVREDF
jgi:hypothetical protein